MTKGPYKPGPPPQWWLQKLYEDSLAKEAQLSYSQNYLDPFLYNQKNPPNVTICGVTYNGRTGKKMNV